MHRATAASSHPEAFSTTAEDIEGLKTLARALGRQAARQMWAAAMRGDGVAALADTAAPKPARRKSGPRHAAR